MLWLDMPLFPFRAAAAALAILLTVGIVKTTSSAFFGPLSKLPGPRLNKWTHLPLAWARTRRRQVHYIHSLHSRYGPIVRVSPGFISFASPETMKTIHKMGTEFRKAPFYKQLQLNGTLVCLTNIKEHAMRRRAFARAFSQGSLMGWEDVITSRVRNVIKEIKEVGKGGKEVDILQAFSRMASGIIGELVLGGNDRTEQKEIVQDIHTEIIVPSSEISNKLPWYILALPRSMLSWVMRQTSPKVYKPLNRERLQENTGEKTRSLFTNILEDGDENSRLSDEIIVREAKAFIVAGTDTTAITATYLIWQVLKHPEVKTRLQRELHKSNDHVSIVGVQGLKYLQCVINETLRLNGAVSSSLPRVTPKGGKEIGGYFIPENTLVSTQSWTLHRNPEVFEDPLAFKPERWEFPTGEMRGSFMPFGIGSRGCIGMQLAQIELALVAAMFFLNFKDAHVGQSMQDDDMIVDDLFILSPSGHKCMVIV